MKTNYFSNILFAMLIILSNKVYSQNTEYGDGSSTCGGSQNTAIGYYAGSSETGTGNVFLGHQSGDGSEESYYNVFVGSETGRNSYEGEYNTFVGYRTGVLNSLGGDNTFLGSKAGTYNTTGSNNVFLGSLAGYSNVNGGSNVYLGRMAGYYSTGSNNVFVGDWAGYNQTGSNKLWIKDLIYGEFDNDLVGVYGKLGIGVKPTTNAMLRVFKSGAPYIELADTSNSLEIGLASATDSFATGAEPGDGVLRTMGGTQSMLLCIPNDENDGDSYIGFTDDYNGLWMKVCNDRQVRIDGTLHVKEVKIETDVWSDDVFDPGYQLSPLKEVEAYIKENRHLPEVPAAGEVIEKGIDVGEMNVILLKKVEELTLHLIEMEKRIRELEGEKK